MFWDCDIMANNREEFITTLLENVDLNNKRILDIGCGAGTISFLINDLFDNVEIIGVDINEDLLKMARENQSSNIKFIKADINNLPDNIGNFDVIIGRRVLMYVENPNDTVNYLSDFLNINGKFIIEESDSSSASLNHDLKLNNEIQDLIWQCVEKEGGHIHIGSQLYSIFKNNNFNIDYFDSKLNLQTFESGSDLAWVFNIMKNRLISNKIIDDDFEIENLEEKLANELKNNNTYLIRDLSYGIIAVK